MAAALALIYLYNMHATYDQNWVRFTVSRCPAFDVLLDADGLLDDSSEEGNCTTVFIM